MVAKPAREKMEYREKIRELLLAGRPKASSEPPPPQKVAPPGARKREVSQERSKKAAAAAVLEAVSSIDASKNKEEWGTPDDPGRSFDELHEWNRDDECGGYWQNGPLSCEEYLRRAFWDQTASRSPTGYIDPGWKRTMETPDGGNAS